MARNSMTRKDYVIAELNRLNFERKRLENELKMDNVKYSTSNTLTVMLGMVTEDIEEMLGILHTIIDNEE